MALARVNAIGVNAWQGLLKRLLHLSSFMLAMAEKANTFCFSVFMTSRWSVSRLMSGTARASVVFPLSFALVKLKSI